MPAMMEYRNNLSHTSTKPVGKNVIAVLYEKTVFALSAETSGKSSVIKHCFTCLFISPVRTLGCPRPPHCRVYRADAGGGGHGGDVGGVGGGEHVGGGGGGGGVGRGE